MDIEGVSIGVILVVLLIVLAMRLEQRAWKHRMRNMRHRADVQFTRQRHPYNEWYK